MGGLWGRGKIWSYYRESCGILQGRFSGSFLRKIFQNCYFFVRIRNREQYVQSCREMTGTLTVENRGKARCLKNEARKRLWRAAKSTILGAEKGAAPVRPHRPERAHLPKSLNAVLFAERRRLCSAVPRSRGGGGHTHACIPGFFSGQSGVAGMFCGPRLRTRTWDASGPALPALCPERSGCPAAGGPGRSSAGPARMHPTRCWRIEL